MGSEDRASPLFQPLLVASGGERTVNSDIVDHRRLRVLRELSADELFETGDQRSDIPR